jgi:hypothetical protein
LACLCDAVFDPALNIVPSEAQVLPDSEAGRALSAVAPCVDGGDGDLEVVGEFLNGEQPIHGFDGRIIRLNG